MEKHIPTRFARRIAINEAMEKILVSFERPDSLLSNDASDAEFDQFGRKLY